MKWQGGDDVDNSEWVDIREAAKLLGLSERQVRRYRERLGATLEPRPVVQPEQEVLTFSRAAVLQFKAEREGSPVPPEAPPSPASSEHDGQC